MNNLKKIALVSALTLSSISAQAEFIKTDWKAVGDNLASVDTDTGIEWMTLTETSNMSYLQVEALLDTTFSGWRLPTRNEVNVMMEHATLMDVPFANNSDYENNPNNNPYHGYNTEYKESSMYFASIFGITYANTDNPDHTVNYSYGTHINDNIQGGEAEYITSGTAYFTETEYGSANDDHDHIASYARPHNGVFLVSDGGTTLSSINDPSLNANNANAPAAPVPLPATLGLLGLAMAGLSFRRKSV
jgi:hypothetical protein